MSGKTENRIITALESLQSKAKTQMQNHNEQVLERVNNKLIVLKRFNEEVLALTELGGEDKTVTTLRQVIAGRITELEIVRIDLQKELSKP